MKETKLTLKQKTFADFYIETGNATESYRRAYNCTEKTASVEGFKNLGKPSVKKYIAEMMESKNKERIASQDEVLEYLTNVMRGNFTEQTLRGIGEGAQTISDIDVGAKDRIKAAELIGKRYALWTEKVEQTGDVTINVKLNNDDDDE